MQVRSQTWPLNRGEPNIAVDNDDGGARGKQPKDGQQARELATKEVAGLVRFHCFDIGNVRRLRHGGFPGVRHDACRPGTQAPVANV